MDIAQELLELQISQARVKVGDKIGLIHSYRTGRTGSLVLDVDGEKVTVPMEYEAVDPIDQVKVDAYRERQAQEALGFEIARSMSGQPRVLP